MAAPTVSPLKTEHEFTLPDGYTDSKGVVHRDGMMRRATALDEIAPLRHRGVFRWRNGVSGSDETRRRLATTHRGFVGESDDRPSARRERADIGAGGAIGPSISG